MLTPQEVEAAKQSTCQKRVVVCSLYDQYGNLLACESNRCAPPGGKCTRLGVESQQRGYPAESTCNWEHAEARALRALPEGAQVHRLVLTGHTFICQSCSDLFEQAGMTNVVVAIVPEEEGCGLREKPKPPGPPELVVVGNEKACSHKGLNSLCRVQEFLHRQGPGGMGSLCSVLEAQIPVLQAEEQFSWCSGCGMILVERRELASYGEWGGWNTVREYHTD